MRRESNYSYHCGSEYNIGGDPEMLWSLEGYSLHNSYRQQIWLILGERSCSKKFDGIASSQQVIAPYSASMVWPYMTQKPEGGRQTLLLGNL